MKNIIYKVITLLFSVILASSNCNSQISTITLWKDSAIGTIWNKKTATIAYGKPDVNGVYKIYLSDSVGNNERLLTFSGWKADRHQWAEEWHPSGKYLFCYVEKPDYVNESGHKRTSADAIPGYGGYTDLWLLSADGKQAWQLTDLPNNYDHGILHGAISNDGSLFAWTERISAPSGNIFDLNLLAGGNVFKIANFKDSTTPSLSNVLTFQPGDVLAGGELESISNDNSALAFYSTFETKNILSTPIYTLDLSSGKTTKLTNESFSQCPTFTPDGKHIIYMTGKDAHIFPFQLQGADWWIMNTDGSNKQRLTFMNVKNNPQSINHYRLAGSLSFLSNNSFLGGVMTSPLGLIGQTLKVDFNTNSMPKPVDISK